MAFARGVGEYGSVIFIAGNMPFKSEIAPLLIVIELEQYDYGGATALATAPPGAPFLAVLFHNDSQAWDRPPLASRPGSPPPRAQPPSSPPTPPQRGPPPPPVSSPARLRWIPGRGRLWWLAVR